MSWNDHIRCYAVGHLETNCYVLERDGACLVVDPGSSGKALARELPEGAEVTIVATHGHHDHVGGVAAMKRETGATYLISKGDAERAQRALELSSHVFDVSDGELENAPAPDGLLAEGDVVRIGPYELRVIEAHGHTPGGIVLLGDGFAFVGDTIFAGSVGRTDLVGGDHATLMKTIKRLKKEIPPRTVLLSGHGPATTMANEIACNPFFA